MKYGKDTKWLNGIGVPLFGEEPKRRLSTEQLARGKIILHRVQKYLADSGSLYYSLMLEPIVSELDGDLIDAGIDSFTLNGWGRDPSDLADARTLEGFNAF